MTEDYDDFNPEVNEWDRETVESKKKILQASQYLQQQEMVKAHQAKQEKIFKNALDKAGLTIEEYNQIAQLDPQFMEEAFTNHVESLVRTVKERPRDPRTGRFVAQSQRPQTGQPQMAQPQPQQSQYIDQSRIEELRAKGKRHGLSDESEIEEYLDATLGKLF